MAISAYDIEICKHYRTDRIIQEIRKSEALGEIVDFKAYPVHPLVRVVTIHAKEVPPFSHPIINDGKVYIDGRGYTNYKNDGTCTINNPEEFKFHYLRALLTIHCFDHAEEEIRKTGIFQLTIFANWIGRSVASKLALEPDVQQTVTIIAAYYYMCLFKSTTELLSLDTRDKMAMASTIARACRVELDQCIKYLDILPPMRSIKELVEALKDHAGSIRFNNFNAGLFVSIMNNSWIGNNAKEIVTVALEHPITWVAIVVQSLNARSYGVTHITKLVEFYDKNNAGKDFIKGVMSLPIFANGNF